MTTEDQMAPDASPGTLSKKAGVRRVNNLPMYIVGGLMGVFLLIMGLVAADRSANQNRPAAAKEEKTGNTSMFAKEIVGTRSDGIIQPQAPKPLILDEGKTDTPQPQAPSALAVPNLNAGTDKGSLVPIARPGNLDLPPRPPSSSKQTELQPTQRTPLDDVKERIRMAKQQQLEEAIKSKTAVSVNLSRGPGSALQSSAARSRDETLARLAALRQQIDASSRDDPTEAYQARLQQIQATLGSGSGAGATTKAVQTSTTSTTRNELGQFAGTGQSDRWKSDSKLEAPRSPYELRAGFVVPATLISGINSDLPGQIVSQVSQNVYDTATGKWLLIPQGSRLIGSYSNDVAYGQARVLVAWQRIVFPDGKALDIGAFPGADSAGYSGFNDQVNNHYVRLFGSAFLLSGITAGVSLSQPATSSTANRPTTSSALSEALGQQLGQATAQLIAKNLNIAPTLEIRPGYRFNVIVIKDLTFSKPYHAFDY